MTWHCTLDSPVLGQTMQCGLRVASASTNRGKKSRNKNKPGVGGDLELGGHTSYRLFLRLPQHHKQHRGKIKEVFQTPFNSLLEHFVAHRTFSGKFRRPQLVLFSAAYFGIQILKGISWIAWKICRRQDLLLEIYFMFRVFNMFARKIESDDPSKERLLKLKRKLGEFLH